MKRFWVYCPQCDDTWVAHFDTEGGCLFAADETGESCSDCGYAELEIQDEYEPGEDKECEREVPFDF